MSLLTQKHPSLPREGDLFKVIHCYGKTFEIRYGYYEERDRYNRYAEPMAIYPDFVSQPSHTDQGLPFVTAMQNPCLHFSGTLHRDSTCEECAFYRHCEELLGICTCPGNKKTSPSREVEQNK